MCVLMCGDMRFHAYVCVYVYVIYDLDIIIIHAILKIRLTQPYIVWKSYVDHLHGRSDWL